MANGVSTGTESETETASRIAAASTEGRILDVATVLFYEHGYHATTMREVAAGVGIKAGSLYNHYASKEELLFQIAEGVMQDLLTAGREAVAAAEEPRDQLRALGPERRATVVAVRDGYERLWREVIDTGRAAYGWVVPDTPVVTFAI